MQQVGLRLIELIYHGRLRHAIPVIRFVVKLTQILASTAKLLLYCSAACQREGLVTMAGATLLISSKNYSSWSLRGFLLARLSGLPFEERSSTRTTRHRKRTAAAVLLDPHSRLMHDDVVIWDTLAIAEYLNEMFPDAHMLPEDRKARARCRSISGEMHSGFAALRGSLPMNLRLFRPDFAVWSAVQADIDRITEIWTRVPDDLERPLAVRQAALDRRRDVRAGGDAVPHLRREDGLRAASAIASTSWPGRTCGNGSPRRRRSRNRSRNSTSSSRAISA